MLIDARVHVVGLIGAGSGVKAIEDRQRVVRRKGAVLQLWRCVSGKRCCKFLINQCRWNLVARGTTGDLQPISWLSKSESWVLQSHRISRGVAHKSHRRALSGFGKRIKDRVRCDPRL